MATLRHVTCGAPGLSRKPVGKKGFHYVDELGKRIRDRATLDRIAKLVIPPAWTDVWICSLANGHLQATGRDQRGRKQYLYHPDWRRTREKTKYDNLQLFGESLPLIRRQMARDIKKRTLAKEKVVAIALSVMEQTFMRVGNSNYRKEYGSYGLTTLRNRHVTVSGSTIRFRFRGKKGVMQEIAHTDGRLARLVKKIKEIPGQELFQYYDENGDIRSLDSGDINDYLCQCAAGDFSTKDYRTWAGSVYALKAMLEWDPKRDQPDDPTAQIVREVASRLGNTPAVCRKYYIYPPLLGNGSAAKLSSVIKGAGNRWRTGPRLLRKEEKMLLYLLRRRPALRVSP